MKIAVFGASGGVGKQVVEQALERGHHVEAVYRSATQTHSRPNLQIEYLPDVFDVSSLANRIAGMEAVISCIGPRRANPRNPWSKVTSPLDLMARFSSSLIGAMSKPGMPKRVVLVSAAGVGPSAPLMHPLLRFVFEHSNVGLGYKDLARMEEQIGRSNLDWTIVQPVTLTNGPRVASIKLCGRYGLTNSISRADVASFLLDCVERQNSYRSERPLICTK